MLFLLNTKQYKLNNQTTFVEDNVFLEDNVFILKDVQRVIWYCFFLADYLVCQNTSNNNNTKVRKGGSERKKFFSILDILSMYYFEYTNVKIIRNVYFGYWKGRTNSV